MNLQREIGWSRIEHPCLERRLFNVGLSAANGYLPRPKGELLKILPAYPWGHDLISHHPMEGVVEVSPSSQRDSRLDVGQDRTWFAPPRTAPLLYTMDGYSGPVLFNTQQE